MYQLAQLLEAESHERDADIARSFDLFLHLLLSLICHYLAIYISYFGYPFLYYCLCNVSQPMQIIHLLFMWWSPCIFISRETASALADLFLSGRSNREWSKEFAQRKMVHLCASLLLPNKSSVSGRSLLSI